MILNWQLFEYPFNFDAKYILFKCLLGMKLDLFRRKRNLNQLLGLALKDICIAIIA